MVADYLVPEPGCTPCSASPDGVCLEHLLQRWPQVVADERRDARELDAARVRIPVLERENARLREALAGLLDGVYGGPPVEEIGGLVMRHGRHRIETVDFARAALEEVDVS